jgi:hypothetical protein
VNTRCCSRTACKQPPVYTLTYVYRDSTAVLGPLATYVEPHCYDLCEKHAARLVVPRGWDVVRLPPDPAQERADDLEALANVVREAGMAAPAPAPRAGAQSRQGAAQSRQGAAQPLPDAAQSLQGPRQGGGGAGPRPTSARQAPAEPVGQGVEVGRRGHLRVVRSVPSES